MNGSAVLDLRADRLGRTLPDHISQSGIPDALWSAYRAACEGELARFGAVVRDVAAEDRTRLLFELSCFEAYIIMGQEVPRLIRRRRFLRTEPDGPAIKQFNTVLLSALMSELGRHGASSLHEIVVTSHTPLQTAAGQQLDAGRRIAQYLQCGSVDNLVESFSAKVGDALDARHNPPLDLVAGRHMGRVIDSARGLLAAVFQS